MASGSYRRGTVYENQAGAMKPMNSSLGLSQLRKRKAVDCDDCNEETEIDAAATQNVHGGIVGGSKAKGPDKKKDLGEERRLKRFRTGPPRTYLERLDRVRTQRMFLINRQKRVGNDGVTEAEVFDLAGSTGNVYQITIRKVPRCTCPDNEKGNQCKHIIYVMVNVLKVREDLAYQLAFLSTELAEIFSNAPVTPQSSDRAAESLTTDTGGSRKPIEGDCPVCVMEFEDSERAEDILWCKAACGQNIHRHCFEQWAKSKPGTVKCVYCRTPWKGDEDTVRKIKMGGKVNAEGYINVASALGISEHRDTSTYHQSWGRRSRGYDGYDYDEY